MRKPNISVLLVITVVFAAFTLGFFLGRNQYQDAISVTVSEKFLTIPSAPMETEPQTAETKKVITFPILLNHADKDELMALPGIGDVLADRILAYRLEHGEFSTIEELLNVEGLGQKRLEDIIELITLGG